MNNVELAQLAKIKSNILTLSRSLSDAPFHGVSSEAIRGVEFAIDKVLEGTGITISSLLEDGDFS